MIEKTHKRHENNGRRNLSNPLALSNLVFLYQKEVILTIHGISLDDLEPPCPPDEELIFLLTILCPCWVLTRAGMACNNDARRVARAA
jgi:hypothetical protein